MLNLLPVCSHLKPWATAWAFCFILLLTTGSAHAQGRVTLSGTVKDAATGEDLSGATVRVVELPGVGTAANAYGVYLLTVPAGSYMLEVSFIGYAGQRQPVALRESRRLDVRLRPDGGTLGEVMVTGKASVTTVSRTQMGVETLDLKQVAKVPVIFGEKDILKTLTLLPGIKSGGDGNGGFFVRGGSADQNLILLDEAPVYNASHLLGWEVVGPRRGPGVSGQHGYRRVFWLVPSPQIGPHGVY